MASACVNNVSPETLPSTTFGWLSPRISTSSKTNPKPDKKKPTTDLKGAGDLEFEFRQGDVNEFAVMLSADELFSDGKLVPSFKQPPPSSAEVARCHGPKTSTPNVNYATQLNDAHLFSPKAPRCSSRWRDLLGLRKNNNTNIANHSEHHSYNNNKSVKASSIKLFRTTNPKDTTSIQSSSMSQPLLKDFDSEQHPIPPTHRHSLSSTSSYDHPRLSLDTEKPRNPVHPGRVRTAWSGRTLARSDPATLTRGVSVDSPRMNPSGKVIFHGLERSSSSPSSFNGGGRSKYNSHTGRGMERSYSANVVRVTPVLNVPVCSSLKTGVFGFGFRKEREGGSHSSSSSATSSSRSSTSSNKSKREG